jgi:hypothetical protein
MARPDSLNVDLTDERLESVQETGAANSLYESDKMKGIDHFIQYSL